MRPMCITGLTAGVVMRRYNSRAATQGQIWACVVNAMTALRLCGVSVSVDRLYYTESGF